MEIKLEHIDLSSIQSPVLFVRYEDPRKILKERRLGLGPTFAPAYRQYLREYQPKERLFACTARNLEYVLEEAAMLAEIPGGCSFEQLRWTCVVHDYRNGMPADQLRQKMGLSMITWRETLPKIQKLARPALSSADPNHPAPVTESIAGLGLRIARGCRGKCHSSPRPHKYLLFKGAAARLRHSPGTGVPRRDHASIRVSYCSL